MEFKRINENTVNCIISENDMDEMGITIDDLFKKKDDALEFLKDIVEKAQAEVEFKPIGGCTPMQITVLPDHSLCLTMSENPHAAFTTLLNGLANKLGIKFPKDFLEELGDLDNDQARYSYLREFLDGLNNNTNELPVISTGEIKDESASSNVNKTSKVDVLSNDGLSKRRKDALKSIEFDGFIFCFNSLKNVIAFSKQVSEPICFDSKLYRDDRDGRYYMHFLKGTEKIERFASVFTVAYEFGGFVSANSNTLAYLEENMDIVIQDKAVNKLNMI